MRSTNVGRVSTKTRLPKGMSLEQLRKIRREDALKGYRPYRYRCATCGQHFPCRHTNSDNR